MAKPGNLIFNFNEGVSGFSFPVSSSKSCSKSGSLEASAASSCSSVSAKANAFVLGLGALLFLAPPDSSALKSVSEKRKEYRENSIQHCPQNCHRNFPYLAFGYFTIAKGGFFSERADAIVISPIR